MFGIVQFENKKKECCVVPLIWLHESQTKCYWPRTIKDDNMYKQLVTSLKRPLSNWGLHKIKKIHYICGK